MPAYITDAGRAALLLGPVTLDSFKLGDAYNYTPDEGDTDIRGDEVLSGVPSAPITTYDNLYDYNLELPSDTTFTFGEIALFFPGGDLFAIYAFTDPITKTADPADLDEVGGTISFFVPTSGDTAIIDLNANDILGQVTIVDKLPAAGSAPLKLYVVMHPLYTPIPIIAFRQLDLWGLTNYTRKAMLATSASTLNSVTVNTIESPVAGDVVQFTDGPYKGICRKVSGVHYSGNTTTMVFASPLSASPPANDTPFVLLTPYSGGSGGSSTDAILRDGSVIMAANFSFGGYRGINLASPSSSTDAATKGYVDTAVAAVSVTSDFLLLDGTRPMTGDLDMDSNKIVGVATPTAGTDAANKDYVDSAVISGGPPEADVDYNNVKITNLADPISAQDAATKNYVDSNFLKKNGTVAMTGNLQMGNNKVTGLATPTASTDAATKAYADAIRNPRIGDSSSASGVFTASVAIYDELHLTLVGNITINFTGGVSGQRFILKLLQDGAGNRIVTLPSTVNYSTDIPSYTATTTPNKFDLLGFVVDVSTGTTRYNLVAISKGY